MEHLAVVAAVALLSVGLHALLLRMASRYGRRALGAPSPEVRWARKPKPLVGGLAFILLLAGSWVGYMLLGVAAIDRASAAVHLFPVLMLLVLAYGIGQADDIYAISALNKLLLQLACGAMLLAFGIRIDLFGNLLLDGALTLFWVVGIMNSINMLDNMDGITGSVGAGILLTVLLLLISTGQTGNLTHGLDQALVAGLLGGILGFLVWNWHPSKLFMGDAGSQLLGFFLAYLGVRYLWNLPMENGLLPWSRQLLWAGLVFLVPILDTTIVTVARLRRGQSPAVGGKDHLTHHLCYLGLPQRLVPLVLGLTTLLSGGIVFALQILFRGPWRWTDAGLLLGYAAAVAGLYVFLYNRGGHLHRTRLQQPPDVNPAQQAPAKTKATLATAPQR